MTLSEHRVNCQMKALSVAQRCETKTQHFEYVRVSKLYTSLAQTEAKDIQELVKKEC